MTNEEKVQRLSIWLARHGLVLHLSDRPSYAVLDGPNVIFTSYDLEEIREFLNVPASWELNPDYEYFPKLQQFLVRQPRSSSTVK